MAASSGGLGGRSPHLLLDPSLASAGGRDGRQRPQTTTCSLYDFLPINSRGCPVHVDALSFPVPTHSPRCPHITPWRELGYHFPSLLRHRGGCRDPERTLAEFTGTSGKAVMDFEVTQAPIQLPALLFYLLCDFEQVTSPL